MEQIIELFSTASGFAEKVQRLDRDGYLLGYSRFPHPTRHIFINDQYLGDHTQTVIDAWLTDNSASLKRAPVVATFGDRAAAKRLKDDGYDVVQTVCGAVYVHPYYTGSRKPTDLVDLVANADVDTESLVIDVLGNIRYARKLKQAGYQRVQMTGGGCVYVSPNYTGSRKPVDLLTYLHGDTDGWDDKLKTIGDFVQTRGDRRLARQLIKRGFMRVQVSGEGLVYVSPDFISQYVDTHHCSVDAITPTVIKRAMATELTELTAPTETYIKAGYDRIKIAELRDVWQYTPVRVPGEGVVYVAPGHGVDVSPSAVAAAMRGEEYVPKQRREKYNIGRTVYSDDFYVFTPRDTEFVAGIRRIWGYKNLPYGPARGNPVWVKIGSEYDNPEITGEVMMDTYAMTLQTINDKLHTLNKHIMHTEDRDDMRELVHVLKHVDYFGPSTRVHERLRGMYGWTPQKLKEMINAALDNDTDLITATVKPLPRGMVVESDGRTTAKRLLYYGFVRKQLAGGKFVYVHPDYKGSRKPTILHRILNGEPPSIGDPVPEMIVCYDDRAYAQRLAAKGFQIDSVNGCYFAWRGDTRPELTVPPPPVQMVVRPVDEGHVRQLKFYGYRWQKSLGTTLFIHPDYTGRRDDASLLTHVGFL